MKRVLLIFCLLISSSVCAQERFKFDAEQPKEMTPSQYATFYYAENNIDEAMQTILQINEEERTAEDWLILGNILQDKGRVADAKFMYNRAISTDKTYYKAYYNLANIYLNENRLNLAVQNYKLASKYNSEFPYAQYNLGCTYLELGQIKKAKYAFIKAIDTKNTSPEFHFNLAYVYKKLNKEKLAKQYLDNYNKLMYGY